MAKRMKDKDRGKTALISSSNMAAAVILVLVLAVVISLLAERHYFRWDLTAGAEHSLSEKTLQILKSLKDPVSIKAFVQDGTGDANDAKRILSAYHYQAPGIRFELIDPDRNPAVARRYNVSSPNTFILEGYGGAQTVKVVNEQNITSALIRLSKGERQKVYWVEGHGERVFEGQEPGSLSALRDTLLNENIAFETINLVARDIPGNASLVVLAAPEKPLFAQEVDLLRQYVDQGGSLLIFLEPFMDGGLKDFLADYGIRIADDIIVDKLSRALGGDYLLPMVTEYGSHEITEGFRSSSFFYMARSVEKDEEGRPGVTLTALGLTSPNSWAETDREALDGGKAGLDDGDRLGPLSLAVIAEMTPPPEPPDSPEPDADRPGGLTGKGKVVVFGDVDFATNKFYQFSGNGDFVTNVVNYLVGREELITIEKQPKPTAPMILNRNQGRVLFWVPVGAVPLVLLVIGLVVWNRRRSR